MAIADIKLPGGYQELPERLNVADVAVSRQVRAGMGERTAIREDDGELTFAELDALGNRFGNALRARGLGRGDYFIIRAPNSRAYAAALLGGLKLGAVAIPASTLFRAWELEDIVRGTEAKLALTTSDLLEPFEEIVGRCLSLREIVLLDQLEREAAPQSDWLEAEAMAPTDVAFVICTSGTTGPPKRVLHGHRWVVSGGDPCVHVAMQFEPDDVVFMPQEFSWLFVLGCAFLLPLSVGACAALYRGRFDPERTMADIERFRVNKLITVPTVLRRLVAIPDLERRYDLSTLGACWCGGEPLAEDTYREATRRFGIEIYELIGQTEVWLYMSNYPGVPNKRGSLGRLLPGRRAAVVDDDGRELGVREEGHLVLAADDPALALGYHGRREEWEARITGGWFYTGDIAYRDEDGYYFYVARADELIKSRSYRIAPGEVETAAMEHPAVLEAGVIGVPDPMIGQRVRACIVLKAGWEPSDGLAEEIASRVRDVIAPYKAPKEVEFVTDLPKTATGKIDHKRLRER